MDSRPQASASVVAAGVVAIIAGAFGALSTIGSLAVFTRPGFPQTGAPFPSALRPVVYGTLLFFLAVALFVVFTGVQVIRLRNWARIALLIVAGCMCFFGIIGIGVIFFTIFVTPPDPTISKPLLATILAFIYGLPVAVALWWLILLTRPAIVAQFFAAASFDRTSTVSSPSRFNNPQVPLAVRIVGWYLASFILFLPFLPFMLGHIPALFFGHLFHGPSAAAIFFLNFALLAVAGIGLLLVKRWSYPLALASQLLLCVNSVLSAFSPTLESSMTATMTEMGLPPALAPTDAMLHQMRYMFLTGLAIPVAIVVVLLLFRRSFFEAAASAL
jgi:hypothetical protein